MISGFPFAFLLILSYVTGIDPVLSRAAATLGATPLRQFRHIVLPLLAPGLAMTFCLAFVQAFSVFPSAVLLGWLPSNLASVVLLYVLKGGLTSAIYTEVPQFFMIVLGFAPVVYLGLKDVGGWHAMNNSLQTVATNPAAIFINAGTNYAPNAWTSAWQPVLAGPAHNPMGVDWFAMIFGLVDHAAAEIRNAAVTFARTTMKVAGRSPKFFAVRD